MNIKRIILIFCWFCGKAAAQPAERTFYPDQLRADLAVLKQALTHLHPGLYKFNSKVEIEKSFKEVESFFRKPVPEKKMYLLLAKLVNKIRCGHTFLSPVNMEDMVSPFYHPVTVIPFCYTVIDRQLVITHNLSEDPRLAKGTVLKAINGIPFTRIIDSLLLVSQTDGRNGQARQLINMQVPPERIVYMSVLDVFFPLFFPFTGKQYELTVQTPDQHISKVIVKGLSRQQRAAEFKARFGVLPKGEKTLEFRMINDSTCLLKVPTFSFYNAPDPYTPFIDSVFNVLSSNPQVRHLVLDLRLNEGGSSKARDLLLSYVLPQDFKAGPYQERRFYSYTKVPDRLIPLLGFFDSSVVKPKDTTVYKLNELGFYENREQKAGTTINFQDFAVKPERFKGKMYLLTSPVNSSGGFEFAWVFQQYKAGKIIGEKTGGTKMGINGGNYVWLHLPYSRIEMDLPVIYQAHPGQPDEGVTPDIIVKPSIEAIAQGQDAQLNYVLKIIQQQ